MRFFDRKNFENGVFFLNCQGTALLVQPLFFDRRGVLINGMKKKNVTKLLLFIFMCIASYLTVFPIIWVMIQSLKTQNEFMANIWSLPRSFNLNAYRFMLFGRHNLARNFMNSINTMFFSTLYNTVLITMAGYAFAKLRFRFKPFFFYFIVINLIISEPVLLLPTLIRVYRMGILNTLPALVLPYFVSFAPIGLIMCRSYMIGIPDSITESAKVDGCGPVNTFFKIILPMSRSIIAALVVLSSMSAWNEFYFAFVSLTRTRFFTMQVRIASIVYMGGSIGHVSLFAAITMSALVIIVIFLALQRYFVGHILMEDSIQYSDYKD